MYSHPKWLIKTSHICLASIGAVLSAQSHAIKFDIGDAELSVSSKLSAGASVRMDDRDITLVTGGNVEGGGASTAVTDDGNLNYDKGDWFSIIFQGRHDLSLNYDNVGAFARVRYWYDFAMAHNSVNHGTVAGYGNNEAIDDSNFGDLAKASNAVLLDAYIYGSYDLGNMPLDLRLGRQVVSWGESTFIQNSVNVINPIDVNALRSPGAELKDALLPVGLLYASLGVTDNFSLEAFYQYEWDKVQLSGCGTYFSTADLAAEGCDKLITYSSDQLLSDEDLLALGPKHASGRSLTGNYEYEGGYVPRADDLEPDDAGQFGVAMRYYAEAFNATEFGLYYINYHERLPIFSVINGEAPQYFFEYPEDTKVFAATFATTINSWSVSGEVSHRPHMPLQINTTELVQPLVKPDAAWSTMHSEIVESEDGTVIHGFNTFPFTQLQFTVINFIDRVLGASRLALVGEIGFDWVHDLPDQSVRRYGRSPTYGMGAFDEFDPFAGENPTLSIEDGMLGPILDGIPAEFLDVEVQGEFNCKSASVKALATVLDSPNPLRIPVENGKPNVNPDYCTKDGYTTDFAWGFRLIAALEYNNVFNGVNLKPLFAYSRDVSGYAPAPNFNEGSIVISYSLSADYLNQYSAKIAYTDYKAGKYNPLRDRDYLSLSVGYSF
jgi:hypothetical protein